MSDQGGNYPGNAGAGSRPIHGGYSEHGVVPITERTPDSLVHKITPQRVHESDLYIHVDFKDGKVDHVRVGKSVVGSEDTFTPSIKDLEYVIANIQKKIDGNGYLRLAHTETMKSFPVDSAVLLAALDGALQDLKHKNAAPETWEEKRVAQRGDDLVDAFGELGELPPANRPKRGLDDFLDSLDETLRANDLSAHYPSPSASGPLLD